ncbi:MAG: protein-(glutamine-N5) methyltransferase, release factor-specific [Acidimicrobiia bacterium]|nr:protein-(glutamine-N5) methyltransferase, release factor-specific [Acidimicrobiia bacterium]
MTDTLSWRALWVETARRLADVATDSNIEARWICQEVGGFEALEWATSLDEPVGHRAVARLDAMVSRRLAGEPLQYVLGSWSFRQLDVMVDRRVLIPRPETEEVVGVALEVAATLGPQLVAADLGTGSGVIALSLAAELPRRWSVEVWGTDRSLEALDVARANLAGIPGWAGTRVRLASGSWFEALPRELRGRLDLLVSNPPYIAASEVLPPEVVQWEPHQALISGPTGLEAIETILDEARPWLSARGAVVLEIGAGQGESAPRLAHDLGYHGATVVADIAGRPRCLVASFSAMNGQ